MSDSRLPPHCSPSFTVCPAPYELWRTGRVSRFTEPGFPTRGSPIPGFLSISDRSPKCNGAQHTCGLPHLSLHGLGLPRTTSKVLATSHGDGVQTIQESHLCDGNVAEGRCILGKDSFQNLEVAHQACVGPWALWYHLLSKEMWCAHVLNTPDLVLAHIRTTEKCRRAE